MSLLEDVFLQNEADEAQELERVLEGDEYDDRPRPSTPNSDDNSEKEDEAEEDKRRVDPTKAKEKRVVKNPRLILNPARLTGPRGIQIIPEHFKDFKFRGKGHEKEDLDLVLKRLEHWAYRLFPKFKFEDCLKKMETLGKKRPVMVHLHKIRSDQLVTEETVVQRESSDEEGVPVEQEEDEFDKLLQQQIELARATPAPGSVKKGLDTPKPDRSLLMPKATSSPSISDEQRERMLKNRQLAEERRLAKLQINSTTNEAVTATQDENTGIVDSVNEDIATRKNIPNIIDSSDDECDSTIQNQSITVDIHNVESNNSDKSTRNEIQSNNLSKDAEDIQIVDDFVASQGDKEHNPMENRGNNSVIIEDNNDVILEATDITSHGDIELNVAGIKVRNAAVEDSSMNILIQNRSGDNSKEKSPVKEIELDIDPILEDVNYSNTGNESSTVKQITDNDIVMTYDDEPDKSENLNKSDEESVHNENKSMDDYGDDLDIMDVDFSEEF